MPASDSLVYHMAEWLVSLRRGAVPLPVWHIARRAVIDTVGVALAGSMTRTARTVEHVARLRYRSGHAAVWGRQTLLSAPGAAFVNGVAAHVLDFDDNSYAGFVHASAVVVPAALAAAQEQDRSGADFLLAYIAGAECEFALATALGGAPYDHGWWTTSLFGATGSCAAACYALGLGIEATANALGLAIVGSAGTKAGFGSDAKSLLVGRTAENGVMLALLARDGITGPRQPIEAAHGLAKLSGSECFDAAAFESLGQSWRLRQPGIDIKRIPVCLSSHAAVDALREIIGERVANPGIVRIVCDVPPIVVKNLMYARPRTAQQAQFSMPFALAATLMHGNPSLALLNDAAVTDAALQEVMRRVEMVSSDRWDAPELRRSAPEGAWVQVFFADGSTAERFRAMPKGSASDPLTTAEIEAKFLACSDPVLGASGSRRILNTLNAVDRLASVRVLFADGTPGSAP
ncbi:MAG: MmgE/PrpD family protein [Janthinobacterium lividum]